MITGWPSFFPSVVVGGTSDDARVRIFGAELKLFVKIFFLGWPTLTVILRTRIIIITTLSKRSIDF